MWSKAIDLKIWRESTNISLSSVSPDKNFYIWCGTVLFTSNFGHAQHPHVATSQYSLYCRPKFLTVVHVAVKPTTWNKDPSCVTVYINAIWLQSKNSIPQTLPHKKGDYAKRNSMRGLLTAIIPFVKANLSYDSPALYPLVRSYFNNDYSFSTKRLAPQRRSTAVQCFFFFGSPLAVWWPLDWLPCPFVTNRT